MSKSKKSSPDASGAPARGKPGTAKKKDSAKTGNNEALWAEAMAEQDRTPAAEDPTGAPASPAPAASQKADHVFAPLDRDESTDQPRDLDMIMDIPVQLSVELGRTRLTIKQLLELTRGSVVELDGLPGEPMDILINDYLVAKGEVVVVDDKYGIRVTEIITPSERLQRLNP